MFLFCTCLVSAPGGEGNTARGAAPPRTTLGRERVRPALSGRRTRSRVRPRRARPARGRVSALPHEPLTREERRVWVSDVGASADPERPSGKADPGPRAAGIPGKYSLESLNTSAASVTARTTLPAPELHFPSRLPAIVVPAPPRGGHVPPAAAPPRSLSAGRAVTPEPRPLIVGPPSPCCAGTPLGHVAARVPPAAPREPP